MDTQIGITERGDAGIDFTWEDKLKSVDGTILITKSINNTFIKKVTKAFREGEKLIIHITCTGYGNTRVEPNVKDANWTHTQVKKLINEGFPASNLVLRIDPIVPTEKGTKKAISIMELFKNTGIKRIRYSFMDMYPHIKERFKKANILIPYESFTAPRKMINESVKMLSESAEGRYSLESCAEYTEHKVGCISLKDFEILGIDKNEIKKSYKQRKSCSCVGNKKELLTNRKQCPHKCTYCYWKH